jgi:hypothetical protein
MDAETRAILMKLLSDDKNHSSSPGPSTVVPSQLHHNAPPNYNPYLPPQPQQGMDKANNVLNIASHVKGYITGFITIVVAVTIFYMDTENNFEKINGEIDSIKEEMRKYEELEDDIDALNESIRSLRFELQQLGEKLRPSGEPVQLNSYDLLLRSDSSLHGENRTVGKFDGDSVIPVPLEF